MLFLKHNWHWKLLSLGLAVMISVLVNQPDDVVRRFLAVPVNVPAPTGLRVAEPGSDFSLRVELEGPGTLLNDLEAGDLRLVFDSAGVEPGERTQVPITVELPPGYRDRVSVSWRPQTLPILLVSDQSRRLSVQVRPLNRPDGWELTEPLQARPAQVGLIGTDAAMARVARVVAPVALEESESINVMVRPQAVDREGTDMSDEVQLDPPLVLVTGRQERAVIEKRVPVQVDYQVPAGAVVVSVVPEPTRVRLIGPVGVVSEIQYVLTDAVQIPVGQTQVSREVALVSPREGVSLDPERVQVTVTLQATAAPRPPNPPDEPAGD